MVRLSLHTIVLLASIRSDLSCTVVCCRSVKSKLWRKNTGDNSVIILRFLEFFSLAAESTSYLVDPLIYWILVDS